MIVVDINSSKIFFQATRISTIQYKRLGAMMTSLDARVSSHVMSVTVQQIVGNITKTVGISESKGAIILVLETFVLPVSIFKTLISEMIIYVHINKIFCFKVIVTFLKQGISSIHLHVLLRADALFLKCVKQHPIPQVCVASFDNRMCHSIH